MYPNSQDKMDTSEVPTTMPITSLVGHNDLSVEPNTKYIDPFNFVENNLLQIERFASSNDPELHDLLSNFTIEED